MRFLSFSAFGVFSGWISISPAKSCSLFAGDLKTGSLGGQRQRPDTGRAAAPWAASGKYRDRQRSEVRLVGNDTESGCWLPFDSVLFVFCFVFFLLLVSPGIYHWPYVTFSRGAKTPAVGKEPWDSRKGNHQLDGFSLRSFPHSLRTGRNRERNEARPMSREPRSCSGHFLGRPG